MRYKSGLINKVYLRDVLTAIWGECSVYFVGSIKEVVIAAEGLISQDAWRAPGRRRAPGLLSYA